MNCEQAAMLTQLRDGDLLPAERTELLGHLEGCVSCGLMRRDGETLASRIRAEGLRQSKPFSLRRAKPGFRSWGWAAAAATLAAGFLLWRGGSGGLEAPSSLPVPPPSEALLPPEPVLAGPFEAAGDTEAVFGRAILAAVRKGTQLEAHADGITLHRGALYLESPGESVRVLCDTLQLEGASASFTVERESPARVSSVWCREAMASDAEGVSITVWSGQVTARSGGVASVLHAGQSVCLHGDVWSEAAPAAPPAWRGRQGWVPLQDAELKWKGSSRILLPELADGSQIDFLVRKADRLAECALRVPVPKGMVEIPLGVCLPASKDWTRVRVTVRGGWCRIQVGATRVASAPLATLDQVGYLASGGESGFGLRAWGGDLVVSGARWRRD